MDGVESYFRKGALHTFLQLPSHLLTFWNSRCVYAIVGIPVFGPTALAARMEGSKAFSKAFMTRHAIPTAAFRVFASSEVDKAIEYVRTCGHRVVLKASGLASGKGVLIPETTEDAIAGLKEMMVARAFGVAGASPLGLLFPIYASCDFLDGLRLPSPPQQVTRSSSKSCSLDQRSPSLHSPTVIPSSHFLPRKTTNVSERAIQVSTRVEWAHTRLPRWRPLLSWSRSCASR